jgi:phosphoglycolate phosphatase
MKARKIMSFENKKAVIFDLDGTLADTIEAIAEAVNMTLEYFGYPTKTVDEVRAAVGNGARMIIRRTIPAEFYDDEETVTRVLAKYDEMYAITYSHSDKMYDGMREALIDLHKSGKKIAVFSNKQDVYVKGLADIYFSDGTISMALGQTELPVKPDIAGLKLITEALGVTYDECVFVGDSGVDLATAKNANMDCICVAWGFVGREGLLAKGADCIIDHPSELVSLIS